MTEIIKLDNPVWNSLNEGHEKFALTFKNSKFYQAAYCPFGGLSNHKDHAQDLLKYASFANPFFIVGEQDESHEDLILDANLVCNQMILENPFPFDVSESITELITPEQKDDLFQLVNLVQPGYFREKTSDLGKYYGIYKDNKLVAAAGQRMKMNHFIEISAVVTHPKYTGNGFAKQLMKFCSDDIFLRNKIAYLHVLEDNNIAVGLYEKLGFKTRRKMSFWKYRKTK